MHRELEGKVVLVTGAARGIGEAVARLCAREGATVLIADISERAGQAVAQSLAGARFVPLDVADESSWQAAVDVALREHGRLDALVNSAGIYRTAPLAETSLAMYEAIVRVNQVGTFLGMKAVLPAMREAGGSIVNISSTSGLKGNQNSVAYGATKWAVRGMTKVAALEFASHAIRVNSVHPGLTDTAMNHEEMGVEAIAEAGRNLPLQRAGKPEEVAEMVLFLVSSRSSYVTGAEFVCDGGMTAGTLRQRFRPR